MSLRDDSKALDGKPAEEILRFAFDRYPRIALSTAFGAEDCVLMAMAARLKPDVKVFIVDTDFLFPQWMALCARFEEKYGIAVEVLRGEVSVEEQNRKYGARLFERDTNLCCALRKVEPMGRALRGLDAWITGLRRDQSSTRAGIDILESYERPGEPPLVKVNPLAVWTRKDTWKYIFDHDVPYHPLLDAGYTSIGCWPCTRAVGAGEGERAGRWDGQKTECGIHTFLERKDTP